MLPSKNSSNKISNKWQDEYRDALKTNSQISDYFKLKSKVQLPYTSFIPRKFAAKIISNGPNSPLWKQFIPTSQENSTAGLLDPIGDKKRAKGNGIIHRYKNRILFTPTTNCPIICRYCFRKNELSNQDQIFSQNVVALRNYLIKHQEVNEVILTGGDPLILSNQKLEQIFALIANLNIKFLRIHTRTPIILPGRIDRGLLDLFNSYANKFTQLIFTLHTNHSDEIDEEVYLALNKLRKIPIKKLTQTVLLKDVNDTPQALIQLFYRAIDCDFTPYYLHHPDQVKGGMHFHLPLVKGQKIYTQLRDELPGWALPHYVVDHPQGSGKQLALNTTTLSKG